MTDSFNWPPDQVDVDALDLEGQAVTAFPSERDESVAAFSSEEKQAVAAFPSEQAQPVERSADRTPPPVGLPSRAERLPSPEVRVSTPAMGFPSSPAGLTGVRRWMLPALAVIVLVQSSWIAARLLDDGSVVVGKIELPAVPNPATATARLTLPPNAVELASQPPLPGPDIAAASAVVTPPTPRAAAAPVEFGNVSIPLPFQVLVFENGRFVGRSDGDALSLAAGSHQLDLVNDSLHFRGTERVTVASGRTATLAVKLPTGSLNLNARPWAEVLVDGQSVGDTPIANLSVPIGSHQVVFRHPEFADVSRSVVVGSDAPERVSVDFEK